MESREPMTRERIVASMAAVPTEILRKFDPTRGVPLPVIGEMFEQIGVAEDVRAAFWNALAAKHVEFDSGPVISVGVEADGRVGIVVDNGQNPRLLLWAPDNMDEGQYKALVDAFHRQLIVDVWWQQTPFGIFVVYVNVNGPPPK